MAATITIGINQLPEFIVGRANAIATINYTPALKQCALVAKAGALENFAGQHSPDGVPWKLRKGPRADSPNNPNNWTPIVGKRGAHAGQPGWKQIAGRGKGKTQWGNTLQLSKDQLLQDTGLLRASVTADGRGHVEVITQKSLSVGTNLEYAGVHQFGHTFQRPERQRSRPWVFTAADGTTVFTRRIRAHQIVIPARPFLGWNNKMIAEVNQIFADYVRKVVTDFKRYAA